MNQTKAYELTLQKLEDLKKEDIDIQIKQSKSRDDKNIIDKYSKTMGTIPSEK